MPHEFTGKEVYPKYGSWVIHGTASPASRKGGHVWCSTVKFKEGKGGTGPSGQDKGPTL